MQVRPSAASGPHPPDGRPVFEHRARLDPTPHAPSHFFAETGAGIGYDHLEMETHGSQTMSTA